MDAITLVLVLLALALGIAGGWFVASARVAARAAVEQQALGTRAAAAETARAGLEAQLAHQTALYRELVGQSRADQAAREERERREQTVLRALDPVRETLDAMQRKVDGLERDRVEQYSALGEQLRLSREADEALRATTESLASAMRSGTTRGVWGETQLRRVVEAAGLTATSTSTCRPRSRATRAPVAPTWWCASPGANPWRWMPRSPSTPISRPARSR